MANVWGNILILVFTHFVGSQGNQCGEPTKYPDRRLDEKYRHISDFKHNDNVEYNCAPGYRRTGGSQISFCKEGSWTPSDLTCEKMSSSHGTKRRFSRQVREILKGAECSRPPVKNNGIVHSEKTKFKQGEQVSITCRTGFNGSGLYTCSTNQTWHPRKPKCVMVKCPVIEIINGDRSSNRVRYKTTVGITCKPGFILRGAQYLRCELNGSWTPDIPKCEPESTVTCSSPAVAHRGIKSGEKPHYNVGETVTISCLEGFYLIGSSQTTCGSDGQWQRLPVCRPEVRCSAPLMVNGKIQSGDKPHYKLHDTVTVSCTEGYDLIGSSQVTCGSDGQWQRLPVCRPEVRCSAPLVVNGKIQSGEKPHYKLHDTVTVSCTEGYDLIGSSQVTCGSDGQWQRLPECRFKVSLTGNCGPAPFYPHAHLRVEHSTVQREYAAEARLRYKCTIGHRFAGGRDIIYCRNGRWTDLQMRCEPKRCGSVDEILNGRIEYTGVSYGDTATVICDEGHETIGRPVRYCRDGGWDGRNAECEPVYCPPPPLVKNADMFDLTYEQVPFGNMVSYRCRTGSLIGASQIHCTKNRTWSAPPPECRESTVTCSSPAVAHRGIKSGEKPHYNVGETVPISCLEGFYLIGSSQTTCGSDGQWQRLPVCRPEVRCSAPLMVNGKIQSGDKPHYKLHDTVTVSCTEGYDLIGSSQLTCGSDGQWQRLPVCRPEVRCSAPLVVNGKIQSGEKPHYKLHDTVTVSCTEGYDLIGSSQVTCGSDGQWQRLPECRFKVSLTGNCGPAPFYPHAHLRVEHSTVQREYAAEARLRYKCTIGHRFAGGRDIIYCRNGRWTDLQMRCEPKRCGSVDEILNGRIEYTGVSYGDTATVICDEGHETIGRPVRYCRDGGWDGRNAECEPVYCPPPPLVKNADMFDLKYEQVPFGNMVSYRCRTGSLIGASQIHCTKNGTWSAPPPECRDIVCPVPKLPDASGMMGYRSVYRFGDTVRINCNPGFRFAEEYYVKCGIDGKWTPEPSKLCRSSRAAHY
ncbi:sushi, von Willebrand factor type A, EGF and pentraxin domain-containing protein 1 [Triplophysa dalaica]|uniref:sushi, von Willebrand factor type A, EGF and pentraxin domain-containing protein 1 n=1 Tax=Triplophysa dalaica TaxID=1582913 RepID=UPI0024DFA8D1|nr:sushi, von Willebrand factor type A, EGF and pentraxin domain-containing protein 1 [Triplophysa dalaica]